MEVLTMGKTGGNTHFSKLGATRRMLGLSYEEVSIATGYSVTTVRAIEGSSVCSKSGVKAITLFYEKCEDILGDLDSEFVKLRDEFMKINSSSFTVEKRIFKTTALRMALGIKIADVTSATKMSAFALSHLEQNKSSNDYARMRVTEYLNSVYSKLSLEEQKAVDIRVKAILTANCIPKNPFRAKLIADGFPAVDVHNADISEQEPIDMAYDNAISSIKEVTCDEDDREYISMLEDENDQLRARISELEDLVKAYELREGSFKAKLKEVKETVPADIPSQVFNNCTVTINIVRKD
jgi:hypothetical protein